MIIPIAGWTVWPFIIIIISCPGNVPNPTLGPLMSTPLINTGQPTLYPYIPSHRTDIGFDCGCTPAAEAARKATILG